MARVLGCKAALRRLVAKTEQLADSGNERPLTELARLLRLYANTDFDCWDDLSPTQCEEFFRNCLQEPIPRISDHWTHVRRLFAGQALQKHR